MSTVKGRRFPSGNLRKDCKNHGVETEVHKLAHSVRHKRASPARPCADLGAHGEDLGVSPSYLSSLGAASARSPLKFSAPGEAWASTCARRHPGRQGGDGRADRVVLTRIFRGLGAAPTHGRGRRSAAVDRADRDSTTPTAEARRREELVQARVPDVSQPSASIRSIGCATGCGCHSHSPVWLPRRWPAR